MNRITVLLIVALVLTFLAGGAVGIFFAPAESSNAADAPTTRPAGPRHRPRGLTEELKLSPEQQEKMREIWSGVMSRSFNASREQSDQIRRTRDEKIRALLSDRQRQQYQAILTEYEQAREALHQRRMEAVEQAVAETKKILTPEQAKKYEEIRKRGPFGRGGGRSGGRRFFRPRRGPDSRPDSRPSDPPPGPPSRSKAP